MQFVRTDQLKIGMRLARPIYNKRGILLFERDSLLNGSAIESVRSFGLLGVYVLDPAEPLPPITEEDREFEKFQITSVVTLQEEILKILSGKGQVKIAHFAGMLIKQYGYLSEKINFYQNLRSKDDFVYRHSLNTAILCTMMTHVLNVKLEEQLQTVCAALVYDVIRQSEKRVSEKRRTNGLGRRVTEPSDISEQLLERAFPNGTWVLRICKQMSRVQSMLEQGSFDKNMKLMMGTKIFLVAKRFDEMTAMDLSGNTESEVKAIQEFRRNPTLYDPEAVKALTESVNILFPGVSVELNTGEKALVLEENRLDVLRPRVLRFSDNKVINLFLRDNQQIQIKDVMKTMDNRYIMDIETLQKSGYLKV